MEQQIELFLEYMQDQRQAGKNTLESYSRDLRKFRQYMEENGKSDARDMIATNLTGYVLYMERSGLSSATISRSIASIRAFFLFLLRRGIIHMDPSEQLRPPKVEKKVSSQIGSSDIKRLLRTPDLHTSKGIRDLAMLELLYSGGVRVSELIELRPEDVHLELDYICCHTEERERVLSFDRKTHEVLAQYLQEIRPTLSQESGYLFLNSRGGRLSRQGVWKMIRQYASKLNIDEVITPQKIRNAGRKE